MPIKTCFITSDKILKHNIEAAFRKVPEIELITSEKPLYAQGFSVFVVPAGAVISLQADIEQKQGRCLAYGDQSLLALSFSKGCDDYLKDPWTAEELFIRIRKAAGNLEFLAAGFILSLDKNRLFSETASVILSRSESIILSALIRNKNAAVSKALINLMINEKPKSRNSRTVDMHISNLRKKIVKLTSSPETASSLVSIRGQGYCLSSG
jgi:DNA-binding winged helix-turn-helix (wHTH) protein